MAPKVGKSISENYGIASRRVRRDVRGVLIARDGMSAAVAFSRRPPLLTQYGNGSPIAYGWLTFGVGAGSVFDVG